MQHTGIAYKTFRGFNLLFFLLISAIMVVPFLNVLCLSLEPEYIARETGVLHIIPRQITTEAYAWVLRNNQFAASFMNSAFITAMGALGGVTVTAMLGYGLTFRKVPGNRLFSFMVLFSMMFSGGTIPSYLLIKQLGLIDSLWSLVIPSLIAGYNVILTRTFFESLPESLAESAMLDGAGEATIFFRIILPLSKPILATILLFCAVSRWNDFFRGMIYITTPTKRPLQVLLREILSAAMADDGSGSDVVSLGNNVKMAIAFITMVPIMCVYPFLQRYFTQGILLGAVKG